MEVECSFVRDVLQASRGDRHVVAWTRIEGAGMQPRGRQPGTVCKQARVHSSVHSALHVSFAGAQGDDAYEMRLKLVSSSNESYPFKDE